jgi:hypothetical protein
VCSDLLFVGHSRGKEKMEGRGEVSVGYEGGRRQYCVREGVIKGGRRNKENRQRNAGGKKGKKKRRRKKDVKEENVMRKLEYREKGRLQNKEEIKRTKERINEK